ncbi:hypothetical protein B4N89_18055 [Embleya scabrispora]|uniref:DUF6542 domain-containing protein n=1 Tax=Embleya scabrispora TaxID=159449 RepID=A0A1T3P0F8_9ACTN|nr:DUF6542 domain-containing protein [Embleya scabrispora]OPC82588.1 hypothetical protein B4N89_18055 [Embleya scabrispora]
MRRRPPTGPPPPAAGPPPAERGQTERAARPRRAHPQRPGRPQSRPAPSRRPPGASGPYRPASTGGLTAAGAAVFGLGGTLLGGLVDHLATDRLGVVFGLAFLISSVFVAWKVRAQDWIAAIIAPPIAFAVTVVLVSTLLGDDTQESYLTRVGLDLLTALSFKAGLLWGGTALATVVVLVKRRLADRA